MPLQWQQCFRYLVFLSYLLLADSNSKVFCPIDSHSDYVTVICFGHLKSRSPLINWTVRAPEQSDNCVGEITCDTRHGHCNQSGSEDVHAAVTALRNAFISVATFRKPVSGQWQRHVTCSTRGDGSAPGVTLCDSAVPGEGNVRHCKGMSPTEPGSSILCDKTEVYCGIYKPTGDRAISSKMTRGNAPDAAGAEPGTLKSVCKKVTGAIMSRRFQRDTLTTNKRKPADCTPVLRLLPRNQQIEVCYHVTEENLKIGCKDATNLDLIVTCYTNGTNETIVSSKLDLNPRNYEKLFCNCSADQRQGCNKSTFVGFAFSHLNQSCQSFGTEHNNSFSLFYIFAGVLSVYCFIFLSATCVFIWKHGAGLYSYYYIDLYRKVKRELIQNRPPLPPPRLPPRRLTASSANAQELRPGFAFNVSTGSSDGFTEDVDQFATTFLLPNSSSGRAILPPARPSIDDELLDDGYLVPRPLTFPGHTVASAARNPQNSAPRRFNSGNGLPPPLPCRPQDGNHTSSNFQSAFHQFNCSGSISSASSLDTEDSLSIHSVDDYP